MKKEEKDDGTQKKPKNQRQITHVQGYGAKAKKEDESKMMSKRCKEM